MLWKGQLKVAQTKLSQTCAGEVGCKKGQIDMSLVWTGVIGLAILDVLERETNFTTWSDEQVLPDGEDYRAISNELSNSMFFLPFRFARALCLHDFCHGSATIPCT